MLTVTALSFKVLTGFSPFVVWAFLQNMFIIIDRVVEVCNTFLYGHLEKKSIVNL